MSPSAPLRLEALRKHKHRSCVWRAGCTKTCPSGSGGGGWIPLLSRGWPPTSSQDEVIDDDQAGFLSRPLLDLRGLGDGLSFHLNGEAQAAQHEVRLARRLAAELLGCKDAAAKVSDSEPDHRLGRVVLPR